MKSYALKSIYWQIIAKNKPADQAEQFFFFHFSNEKNVDIKSFEVAPPARTIFYWNKRTETDLRRKMNVSVEMKEDEKLPLAKTLIN